MMMVPHTPILGGVTIPVEEHEPATVTIQFRRGTKAEWIAKNPILADAEPGVETDTNRTKLGNGYTRWLDLSYDDEKTLEGDVVTQSDLNEHVNSLTPHPVYDNGPSLFLLYENAKV